MLILVVEDERKVGSFIKKGLEEESYSVDLVRTGPEAEYRAEANEYDLIVLDLMLPGKDGVDVCRSLRARGLKTPILMLTARATLQDKVEGLNVGADDYLTKPFAFEEFLARVRALLRRGDSLTPMRVGSLVLDRGTKRARRGNREIVLTPREYSLLEYFMRHPGQVISRTMLTEKVWDADFDIESNVIDVTVSHLRNKVDRSPDRPLIQTVRGFGYMLNDTEE
jgi:DNA-binding response OmpR family regulator